MPAVAAANAFTGSLHGLFKGQGRRNASLKPFYDGLIAHSKPPKLALVAAMRKLLHAAYSVTKNRKPFTIKPEKT